MGGQANVSSPNSRCAPARTLWLNLELETVPAALLQSDVQQLHSKLCHHTIQPLAIDGTTGTEYMNSKVTPLQSTNCRFARAQRCCKASLVV
jgi:hypothetical protein